MDERLQRFAFWLNSSKAQVAFFWRFYCWCQRDVFAINALAAMGED